MEQILVIKTGALGDVLRTTSILPGLRQRHPGVRIEWVTAPAARDLLRTHEGIDRLHLVDPKGEDDVDRLLAELDGKRFDWTISLDDEPPLCRLAASVASERLSGATLGEDGARLYTPDVGPWFDMGLLSVHGKQEADRRKKANRESHPAIYARMLEIPVGEPQLALPEECHARAAAFAREAGLAGRRPAIGLNTGSGGRWVSKQLPVERTVELVRLLRTELGGEGAFVLFGGPEERERNAEIGRRVAADVGAEVLVDAGTDNPLLEFAARVALCDLLVASDSLALHVAVAQRVPVVAFFAPTSAAEIELYGRGEKIESSAPDACSYRPDADNSSITPQRLAAGVRRTLGV